MVKLCDTPVCRVVWVAWDRHRECSQEGLGVRKRHPRVRSTRGEGTRACLRHAPVCANPAPAGPARGVPPASAPRLLSRPACRLCSCLAPCASRHGAGHSTHACTREHAPVAAGAVLGADGLVDVAGIAPAGVLRGMDRSRGGGGGGGSRGGMLYAQDPRVADRREAGVEKRRGSTAR